MKLARVVFALAASLLLPAQALAQSAPGTTSPVKAAVVVQKSQVVVQTSGAPAAPAAPAAKPVGLPAATLTVDVPQSAYLGETVRVQVALVGPDGSPVNGATVDFSTAATFLNTPGNVVFAHAVTDARGTASIDWQPRSDGSLNLNVSFAGDKHLAAANTKAIVEVKGGQQLYQQQAGVVLPGLNAAPALTATAALAPVASPWPKVSGWPLVVVLLIVWSLYARAVTSLFTIARGRAPTIATGAAR